MINVSNFKVVYGDKVLNALEIGNICFSEDAYDFETRKTVVKPKLLEVLAINEDGNIISIYDEAWRFQFLPKVARGE